nr:uncharacterized protein LOC113709709 [Coffea arabica]
MEFAYHSKFYALDMLVVAQEIGHIFILTCTPESILVANRTRKGEEVETMERMFFQCPIAQMVWKIAPVRCEGLRDLQTNMWRWWEAVVQTRTKEQGMEQINLTTNILWLIWKARNKLVFE